MTSVNSIRNSNFLHWKSLPECSVTVEELSVTPKTAWMVPMLTNALVTAWVDTVNNHRGFYGSKLTETTGRWRQKSCNSLNSALLWSWYSLYDSPDNYFVANIISGCSTKQSRNNRRELVMCIQLDVFELIVITSIQRKHCPVYN